MYKTVRLTNELAGDQTTQYRLTPRHNYSRRNAYKPANHSTCNRNQSQPTSPRLAESQQKNNIDDVIINSRLHQRINTRQCQGGVCLKVVHTNKTKQYFRSACIKIGRSYMGRLTFSGLKDCVIISVKNHQKPTDIRDQG